MISSAWLLIMFLILLFSRFVVDVSIMPDLDPAVKQIHTYFDNRTHLDGCGHLVLLFTV
jgi:hypothetical protein